MKLSRAFTGAALTVALLAAGGGTAWAGGLPGDSGRDDNDDHHRANSRHCPGAEAAGSAGLPSLSAALVSLVPPGSGAPGPVPPLPGGPQVPDRDPFYSAPEGFAACNPGTVLRSRTVTILGLTSVGSLSAYQLLFRSTDARGEPIAAVTTLLQPTLPAPGPRKVVSYQVFEDSMTTGCAPSYALRTNSGLSQPIENGPIAAMLANGWDVLIPDHQGPHAIPMVGPLAGHITLDSIRAVENFEPAGLDGPDTPVGLMGYSGGSIPTIWANALARDYAPELNLVGIAAGGIFSDYGPIYRAVTGPPFFGAVFAFGIPFDRAYPDLDYDSLITEQGRAQAERFGGDANGCGGYVYGAPLAKFSDFIRAPDPDAFLAIPRVGHVIDTLNLAKGPTFTAPALFVQAIGDEAALISQVDDLVTANCRHGATIDYRRTPGEHFGTIPLYVAQSMVYLRDRFANRAPANTCS
jgi:hypothetical protein